MKRHSILWGAAVLMAVFFCGALRAQDLVLTNEILKFELRISHLENQFIGLTDEDQVRDHLNAIRRAQLRLMQAYHHQHEFLVAEKKSLVDKINRNYDSEALALRNKFDPLNADLVRVNKALERLEVIMKAFDKEFRKQKGYFHQSTLIDLRKAGFSGRVYTPLSFIQNVRDEGRPVVVLGLPEGADPHELRPRVKSFLEYAPENAMILIDDEFAELVGEVVDSLARSEDKNWEIVRKVPRASAGLSAAGGSILFTEDHLGGSLEGGLRDAKLDGPSWKQIPGVLALERRVLIHHISPRQLDLERMRVIQAIAIEEGGVALSVDTTRVVFGPLAVSDRNSFVTAQELNDARDVLDLNRARRLWATRLRAMFKGININRACSVLGVLSLWQLGQEVCENLSPQERRVPDLGDGPWGERRL